MSLIDLTPASPPASPPAAIEPQPSDDVAAPAAERPEWLPEKFWVDGQPAYDKLAQSYGELERMRGTMKEALVAELEQQRLANRPETADAYQLPVDDRLDLEAMGQSPIVQWWRQYAHEQGYSQEQFESAIKTYAETQVAQVTQSYEAEMRQLGDNAKARTEAVALWADQMFSETEREAIAAACTTAAGIVAMEKIMDKLKASGAVDPAVFEPKPQVTRKDIEKMMQDRRYWHPADRDPAFVRQVEEYFAKSFTA